MKTNRHAALKSNISENLAVKMKQLKDILKTEKKLLEFTGIQQMVAAFEALVSLFGNHRKMTD